MNPILIAAALIPAFILVKYVYKLDRVEKESKRMIWVLLLLGCLSALLASVCESIGEGIIALFFSEGSTVYRLLQYFAVVALSEEGFKYLLLKKRTWNDPEFNCSFDAVLYSVCVSLGFAALENIVYVGSYGFATAVARAVTAIPGHACFGVFMGAWYGMAKKYECRGDGERSLRYRRHALMVAVLSHGAYDFIASMESAASGLIFLIYIGVMFYIALKLVKKLSKEDDYI